MKTICFFLLLLMPVQVVSAQAARVEIHHIGAGDGDATLFIFVDTMNAKNLFGARIIDTAVVLIDGQRSSGGKEVWRYMKDTLTARFPTVRKIDAIVISHLHIDHYGGIPRVIDSIYNHGWAVGAVYDRQSANYSSFLTSAILDSCYDSLKVSNPNATSFNNYNKTLGKYGLLPTKVPKIGDDLLDLLGFSFRDMELTCEVSCGVASAVSSDADTCFLPVGQSSGRRYYTPKSENDLSIGFVLRYEGFSYLSSGDLGGLSGGNYVDGETPMTKGLMRLANYPDDYHICSNKVSHHGSRESTTAWFATTNDFTVSVITACLRSYGSSSHALPTQTAIQNLRAAGRDSLFYTFVPNNPQTLASYWTKNNLNYYNDVILKIIGPPGFDQNLSIQVIQRPKNKAYAYQGTGSVRNVICNKGHSAYEE